MDLVVKDRQDFQNWEEAVDFLKRSPLNFVKSRRYPPSGLSRSLRSRVIILGFNRRAGYFHLPESASQAVLFSLCRLILRESEPDGQELNLADFIQDFADQLIGKGDLEELSAQIVAQVSKLFHADGAAILAFNEDRSALRFVAAHSTDAEVARKLRNLEIPVDSGIAGWVALNRKPLLVQDVQGDRRFHSSVDKETDFLTTNMIAAPIVLDDELVGVIEVVNRKERVFSELDLPALSVIAAMIAVFSEKARLRRQRANYLHAADKAEIANSVLHNIGTVLNSVSVSCSIIESNFQRSKIDRLMMANRMLEAHMDQLATFFTEHPKGKLLPTFWVKAVEQLEKERRVMIEELQKVINKTNLMRDIIETQQTIAKVGSSEAQDFIQVVDEALSVLKEPLRKNQIGVEKNYLTGKPVRAQKAKLIHILINLVKNGIEAMSGTPSHKRTLHLESGETEKGDIYFKITDHGIGATSENLAKMFTHGFTTKDDGHGFGLAYCAKAMEEMNGSIEATSGGPGKGCCFTLIFPPIRKRVD